MANIKITDLTAYTDPDSTDVLPIVDVGADVTKKVSIADLLENAGSGTEALPGIAFDGDPNTGIYRPGADQVAISTNGTGRLLIDSDGDINIDSGGVFYDATNNRLGIGTTSPGSTLSVRQTEASHQIIRITRPGSDIGSLYLGNDSNNNALLSSNNTELVFGKNEASTFYEYARIDSSGRLGLGTSSPQANIHLANASSPTIPTSSPIPVFAPKFNIFSSRTSLSTSRRPIGQLAGRSRASKIGRASCRERV